MSSEMVFAVFFASILVSTYSGWRIGFIRAYDLVSNWIFVTSLIVLIIVAYLIPLYTNEVVNQIVKLFMDALPQAAIGGGVLGFLLGIFIDWNELPRIPYE